MKFEAKPLANPMGALQRTSQRIGTGRARLPVALAETPPRDGPFALSAQDVALNKPPRTRVKRKDPDWFSLSAKKLRYEGPGRPASNLPQGAAPSDVERPAAPAQGPTPHQPWTPPAIDLPKIR